MVWPAIPICILGIEERDNTVITHVGTLMVTVIRNPLSFHVLHHKQVYCIVGVPFCVFDILLLPLECCSF